MKQIILALMIITAINCKAQDIDFRTPKEMAIDLPDSTIIGYEFISQETVDSRMWYSAYDSEYEFLDKLAKADRLIRNFDHIDNLFTWVYCCDGDTDCFNEQFMRQVVDANRWASRSDYKYDRIAPIYYIDFKRGFLQCVLDK